MIYTNSLALALSAIKTIRTGGVIVNGTSRWRSDQMPYGGVKDSGIGREGPEIRDPRHDRGTVLRPQLNGQCRRSKPPALKEPTPTNAILPAAC
ncbi:MAG: aldehyde dehydrogenase family protein [Betaproteobacteria bacterium]|nr:aldehyde dehydrogenase family protein [Betaproteobacteria bacterium]